MIGIGQLNGDRVSGGKVNGCFRSLASLTSLVFALAVSITGTLAYAPQAEAASGCPPYEVIGARGSGQNGKTLLGETNYMGPEVHDFFAALQQLIGKGVVKGYGVRYPAVTIGPLESPANFLGAGLRIGFLGKYTDSVSEGTKDVKGQINARHARCPDTRFILAGYSQGAQAIGKVLENTHFDPLIAAGVLFGDPYFNADSWSSRAVAASSSSRLGGADPSGYGILGVRGEWPESLHGRVFSYCHYHDWICNSSNRHHVLGVGDIYLRNPADMSLSAHKTPAYRLTENRGRGDAGEAALEVARLLGYTPPPIPYLGPIDIAVVIDSTGSMWDEIEGVKEDVAALAQQIAAVDPDYRLALVDYKDSPDQESAYQSRLDTDFTTDIPIFEAALDSLEAEGGGDEPESVYSGLMTALNLNWRAGSKKIVIQIGDAPAKDPEPITGYTLRSVQAKALSVDPATVDTIQSGEGSEAQESFSQIAAATGGQYLQLQESGSAGLVTAISGEVRQNAIAPIASLVVPSAAIVGRQVTLSATGSQDLREPIAGYDWDFNGDGVFDASTTDPVATYTYPAPFSGTVVVRVRSASGLASMTSTQIIVSASPSKPPAKPGHLRKAIRHSKLTLSWSAGKGASPQWFTVFDRRGHALERIAVQGDPYRTAKGKRRRFSVTVPGLRRHRVYRFSVAAGNDAGESRRTGPVSVRAGSHEHRGRHRHRRQ